MAHTGSVLIIEAWMQWQAQCISATLNRRHILTSLEVHNTSPSLITSDFWQIQVDPHGLRRRLPSSHHVSCVVQVSHHAFWHEKRSSSVPETHTTNCVGSLMTSWLFFFDTVRETSCYASRAVDMVHCPLTYPWAHTGAGNHSPYRHWPLSKFGTDCESVKEWAGTAWVGGWSMPIKWPNQAY